MGWLNPEFHKRILEEGYSFDDILFAIVLGIVGIAIICVFLHPKMRKKFNTYGTDNL